MKLNYLSIFTLIFIFFLAMNFIAAEEIGENCTDESLKIDLDTQDPILSNSNQEYISNCDENAIFNSDELLTDDNSIKHVYVSPNGYGNGSHESPSSFIDALNNLEDNTIIHMADGNYTTSSSAIELDNNKPCRNPHLKYLNCSINVI